jgi:hypothetical protein
MNKIVLLLNEIKNEYSENEIRNICHRMRLKPKGKDFKQFELLRKEISHDNTFEIFNNKMQFLGFVSWRTQFDDVVEWLLFRAYQVNAKTAYEDLLSYINNDTFQAYAIMMISGLPVDNGFEICDGVKIVNFYSVCNKFFTKMSSDSNRYNPLPSPRIDSCLLFPFVHEKLHLSDEQMEPCHYRHPAHERNIDIVNHAYKKMHDFRLLFTLLNRGPQSIGCSVVVEDNIPNFCGVSWGIDSYRSSSFSFPLIGIFIPRIAELYKCFNMHSESIKDHIRVMLKCLNYFNSSSDLVQKAIDLRIAMESVFLDKDNNHELAFRLSLRAALLEESDKEKEDTRFLFKKVYNITSEAIHTGRLGNKSSEKATELFKKVIPKINAAVMKIIKKGEMNWNDLELNVKRTMIESE